MHIRNPNDDILKIAIRSIGGTSLPLSEGTRWTRYRYGHLEFSCYGMRMPFDTPEIIEAANDKLWSRDVLKKNGLPVVDWTLCDTHKPVKPPGPGTWIVKVATGGKKGSGVRAGIQSDEVALHADALGRFSRFVLLEPYITGRNYRVLVLGSEVISIVERCTPIICGDGTSTVAELLLLRNNGHLFSYDRSDIADGEEIYVLSKQGITLNSVLAPGKEVVTSLAVNVSRGAAWQAPSQNTDLAPIIRFCIRAASTVGLTLAGIDVIDSPTLGVLLLEVNPSPGIVAHTWNPIMNLVDLKCAQQILCRVLQCLNPGVVPPNILFDALTHREYSELLKKSTSASK